MNEGEKRVVGKMITIYCRSKHRSAEGLCEECEALRAYALQRLERCPFGEDKPTCATCTIHCYKNDLRLKMKEVMRMAGPRMLFRHPLETVRHFHQEHRRQKTFVSTKKANQNSR